MFMRIDRLRASGMRSNDGVASPGNLEVVEDVPEGGKIPERDGHHHGAFAPHYVPEEIFEIASELYRKGAEASPPGIGISLAWQRPTTRGDTLMASMPEHPTLAQIRDRAYELWERNHRPDGFEIAFWLLAERELRAEHPTTPTEPEADAGPREGST